VPISDLHSGGSTALFPHYRELQGGFWQFQHTRYTPSGKQCDMADHWDFCADETAKARLDKRMIIVLAGDMIDGKHHQTLQLTTHDPHEQGQINIWLMQRFMKRAGFEKNRGDLLYMVTGTESHTGEVEQEIAKELGAEPHPESDAFDFLPMDIHGKLFWFLHQGAGPGKGANKGETLRNWLKNKYWELLEDNKRIPDYIISGHYHNPVKTSYERPNKMIHGMILPSFQLKTRFGYKVAAAELEKIGIRTVDIGADGEIKTNEMLRMRMRDETVRV
jgi:hypothetical protein